MYMGRCLPFHLPPLCLVLYMYCSPSMRCRTCGAAQRRPCRQGRPGEPSGTTGGGTCAPCLPWQEAAAGHESREPPFLSMPRPPTCRLRSYISWRSAASPTALAAFTSGGWDCRRQVDGSQPAVENSLRRAAVGTRAPADTRPSCLLVPAAHRAGSACWAAAHLHPQHGLHVAHGLVRQEHRALLQEAGREAGRCGGGQAWVSERAEVVAGHAPPPPARAPPLLPVAVLLSII